MKRERRLKTRFKKMLMCNATGYFSSSEALDHYFIKYGGMKEKIFRYPFSSVFEKDIKAEITSIQEKSKIRKELGITEEKVVLCVGQFIHRKGFDIILRAWSDINSNAGLYIVGGGGNEEYKEIIRKNKLERVHFIVFKEKKELNNFYTAADVFVLPTREDIWGLVINEALANGLPVVSTDKCVAASEMVTNEINGYIVPSENEHFLADRVNIILENRALQEKMSKQALKVSKKWTIEKMAQCHFNIIKMELGR